MSIKNLILRSLLLLTGSLVAAVSLVLLFILTVLLLPYRLLVSLVARLWRPDLQDFITGLTSVFMLDSMDKPTLNLLSCKIINGRVPLENFQRLVQERVINRRDKEGQGVYRRLQQTYTNFMGYAFWKWDPDFLVENHVRIYDYGESGTKMYLDSSKPCMEEDLRRIMGDLLAAPWKENRSPWEFLLIYNYQDGVEGFPGEEKMVFVSRFHHGIGDGYSSSQLLQDMGLNYAPSAVPAQVKLKFWMQILLMMAFPFKLCWDLADNFIQSLDWNNAWRPATELAKSYYTSFTRPIPVHLVKEIKAKYKVSYVAVLYAAIGGGIQRIMEEAGQKIPQRLAVFNPVPKPNHPGGMVNHMMWIFTLLPIREKSIVARLEYIQKDFNKLKSSLTPVASDVIVALFGLMPKRFRRGIRFLINSTLMASNFPVPPDAPVFEGFKVSDVIFGCGTGEVRCGANIFMIGLGGFQRIVVNIDKNIFPSEDIFKKLGSYIEEDLRNLLYSMCETDNANVLIV